MYRMLQINSCLSVQSVKSLETPTRKIPHCCNLCMVTSKLRLLDRWSYWKVSPEFSTLLRSTSFEGSKICIFYNCIKLGAKILISNWICLRNYIHTEFVSSCCMVSLKKYTDYSDVAEVLREREDPTTHPWQKPMHCHCATSTAVRRTTSWKNWRYISLPRSLACLFHIYSK